MTITIVTTKAASLDSGSEVRNYHLFRSIIQSGLFTKVNILFFPLDLNERSASFFDDLKNEIDITFKKRTVRKRSVVSSIASFIQGKIPHVESLRSTDLSTDEINTIEAADVLFLSELDSYFVVERLLRNVKKKPLVILDSHNVDYLRFKSEIETGSVAKKILGVHLPNVMQRLELQATSQVDHILCCSEVDKKYFTQSVAKEKITVIPNGIVPVKDISSKHVGQKKTVLFMGILSYSPNEQGLQYYFDKVHDLVKAKVPTVDVQIIGKNPPTWLKTLAERKSEVSVLGFVPEVASYLGTADVCICPLHHGSGTRLKVLEYMAAGKPIISTSIGAEGLDVIHGENILIADDAISFADGVIELLNNSGLAQKLGSNARKLAHAKYNWQTIGKNFTSKLKELVTK